MKLRRSEFSEISGYQLQHISYNISTMILFIQGFSIFVSIYIISNDIYECSRLTQALSDLDSCIRKRSEQYLKIIKLLMLAIAIIMVTTYFSLDFTKNCEITSKSCGLAFQMVTNRKRKILDKYKSISAFATKSA